MGLDISQIYRQRFTKYERVHKLQLWKVLIENYLQRFVSHNDTIVDLGAGNCEFINQIQAGRKIAVDINQDVKKFANSGVEVIISSITNLRQSLRGQKTTVFFLSNLLEHLGSKEEVFKLIHDIYNLLPRGGKILIMQPDIKRVGGAYWDFFDHKIPLTERSVTELLLTAGYKILEIKSPFLPYSVKYRIYPLSTLLLKWYIRVRPLHFIFGKQFFVCAVKP